MSALGIGDLAKRSKMPSLTVVIASPMPKSPPLPKEAEEPDEDEDDDDDEDEDDDEDSPEEQDNKRIVAEATKALQGKSKHPDEAINDFIETFGKRELAALRAMVRGDDTDEEAMASGRLVEGPGRGMEDRIKARVGNQPVLLSDGEYVFPADVVSMLGDGSTQAGVRMLEAMIERVRTSKTGSSKQAKALDKALLPV